MSAGTVRIEVHYAGRVQGVGFRWRTTHVARRYDVAGSVRNLGDGRVRLVVEAVREDAEGFLAAVRGEMGALVVDEARVEAPPTHEFAGFVILR